MQPQIFETQRLLLKAWTPELFKHLFASYDKEYIKKELGLATDEEYEVEKDKSDRGHTTYRINILHFKIAEKESGIVMGGVGYHNWLEMHHRAELGYALNNDIHKNKGYVSEALEFIIPYGFNQLGLNRIEAFVGPQNVPSLRLVEKFGFTREGQLKQHFNVNGVLQDSVVFGLLKEEWERSLKS
jgi:ribosomal-protein-alanine N-acetyltransferase